MSSAAAGGSGGNSNDDENLFKNVFSMLPPGLSKEAVISLIKETCGIDDKTPAGQDILVRFTKSKGFIELFEPTPEIIKSNEPSPRRPSVEDPTFSALINDTIIGNQYQNKLRVDVDDIISSLQLDADDCIIMDDDEDHDQEVEKVVVKKEKIDDEPKVKKEKIDDEPPKAKKEKIDEESENISIKIKEEKIDSSTSLKEKVKVKKEEKSDNEDSTNHHKKKKKKKKHSHNKEERRRIINDSGSEEEDDIDVKKIKKDHGKEKSSENEKKEKKHKKKDKHRKRDKSKDSHDDSSSNSSDDDDEGKIGGSNLKLSRPVKVGAGKVKSEKIEISPPTGSSKKYVPVTFLKPPSVPVPTRQKEVSLSEADIIQNEELEEELDRKRMEEKAKREKEYKERSKQREAHQPKKKIKEEVKEEEILGESFYNNEQAKLKSKIYKPFIDTEFAKYQKDFGLKTCSIITFDLLTMGSQFKTYGSKDGDPTAIVEKVREKVLMPIERIKDVQKIEKCKKHSYEKKLNKMIDWKDLKEQGITDGKAYCKELRRKEKELEKERDKERKERERERQERKDKERKERELQRQKSKHSSVSDGKRKEKEKSKHVKNVIISSSSSDSDDDRKKKKESSSKNKSKDKNGEYTSAGVRILPFEKPREETIEEKVKKAKERILADKHKQNKTEKQKQERAQKLQERINADNLRTIGYNSYKIPKLLLKAQKLSDAKVTTSTPLTDVRVDLKFEKFCKVNREATRGDWLKHQERERQEREKIEKEEANKPSIWDLGADDFHSDEEVVEKTDEYDEYVPPPISEVEFCPLSHMIFQIIKKQSVIELGVEYGDEGNPTDNCAKKIAWWLKLIDTSEYISEISCPELDDETISFCSDQGSLASFLGNVSDIDDDDTQCNVISSTASIREKDPDLEEEFCGQSLINSKIRKEKDTFIDIFNLRPGSNYDKATTFQAQCNICDELIVGTKHLAAHIRGDLHRDNLRNLSLNMAKPEEKEGRVKEHKIKIRLEKDKKEDHKNDILDKTSTGLSIKIPAKCQTGSPSGSAGISRSRDNKNDDRRKRSRSRERKHRSRSRSPRSRRRSRSPADRRRSKDRDRRGGGGRRSRSPYDARRGRRRSRSPHHRMSSPIGNTSSIGSSSKSVPKFFDTREFQERMKLTVDGAWNKSLDHAWDNAEREGKILDQDFEDRKLSLAVTPENHPKYNEEWTEYWERRYQEVEKDGKNPDTYDYIPEWKDFWLTRVDFLLRTEQEIKRKEIKAKYRIDLDSLLKLHKPKKPQPPPAPHNLIRNVDPPPPGIDNVVIMNNEYAHRSMSISSGSNKERQNQSPTTVTAEDCKNKWASLTGVNVKPTTTSSSSRERDNYNARAGTNFATTKVSKVTTAPIPAFDSSGFDLVKVLRLMTQNEEQLSFYAQKIKDYYLMAEEMDSAQPGMSWSLLKEKQFVELMFKCRDRFMNIIKANILQRDTLKCLNMTVYGMTEILENDECQKFKPPPSPPPQAVKPQLTPIYDNIGGVSPVRSTQGTSSSNRKLTPEEFIKSTMKNVPHNSKIEIAHLVAKTLVDLGKEKMNNVELNHFLHHVLTRGDSAAKFGTIGGDAGPKIIKKEGVISTGFGIEENLSNIRYEGRALPPLPLFEARASSPPRAASDSHLQPVFATNQDYSRRAAPPPTSGRRSPFSRRDFSGNPDKDERRGSHDYDRDRYRRRRRSPETRNQHHQPRPNIPNIADEEEDWDRDEREEQGRMKRTEKIEEVRQNIDACENLSDGEIQISPTNPDAPAQINVSIDQDQISEASFNSDIVININTNTSFLKSLEKISSSSSSPLKSIPTHKHGKSSSQLSNVSDNSLVLQKLSKPDEYDTELQPSPPLSCVMSDAFSEKESLESGECDERSPLKLNPTKFPLESESIPNFNSNIFSEAIECLKYSTIDQDLKIYTIINTSLSNLSNDQINYINSKWTDGKSKVDEFRKFSPGILAILFNDKLKELLSHKEKEMLEDGEIPIVEGVGSETNLTSASSSRRNSTSSHQKKSKRRRRRKRSVGSGKSSNSNSSSNPNRKRYRSR